MGADIAVLYAMRAGDHEHLPTPLPLTGPSRSRGSTVVQLSSVDVFHNQICKCPRPKTGLSTTGRVAAALVVFVLLSDFLIFNIS